MLHTKIAFKCTSLFTELVSNTLVNTFQMLIKIINNLLGISKFDLYKSKSICTSFYVIPTARPNFLTFAHILAAILYHQKYFVYTNSEISLSLSIPAKMYKMNKP